MIGQIGRIAAISELLAKADEIRFNTILPLSVTVLKETTGTFGPLKYLLQLGTRQIETRSQSPLEEGAQYWAQLAKSPHGTLTLSHLVKKPPIFDHPLLKNAAEPIPLQLSTFIEIFKNHKDPALPLKEQVMTWLAEAKTPQEFQMLTPLLLGFEKGVQTTVIEDEHNRRALVQMRRPKALWREGLKVDVLEFYAAFANLGPMRGQVEKSGENISLQLEAQFELTCAFLVRESSLLEGFSNIRIRLTPDIAPLSDLGDKLLNLSA